MDENPRAGYERHERMSIVTVHMDTPADTGTRDAIARQIRGIVVSALHLEQSAEALDPAARLDTMGLDSLNIVDILIGIERTFDITIDEAEIDFAMLESIDSLTDFVHAQRA